MSIYFQYYTIYLKAEHALKATRCDDSDLEKC